jgi:imidazolonepropionase-like amidohydrolase
MRPVIDSLASDHTAGEPARLAIRAKRVLDVQGGRWLADTVVVVRGDRIEQVGGPVPEGTPTVDLGDRSLLPGLIDTHTHVLLQGNRSSQAYAAQILQEEPAHRVARAVRSMEIALRHGFTCLRDLGTEGAGFADVALRDASTAGIVRGPRMLVAGPAIGRTYSYPILGYRSDWEFPVGVAECDGVEGCRREVRRQVARGIDWLKVYATAGRGSAITEDGYVESPPPWTESELRAIVDESHTLGIPVAAHAMAVTGTEMAVAAGVDSIEHGSAIRPQTALAMAQRGIPLVPTLLIGPEKQQRGFLNCVAAGVTIVFGTDHGFSEWEEVNQASELEIMVGMGLSPAEVIRSATIAAAEMLGQKGVLGEITAGAQADLIACPGDPLTTIAALTGVDVVMKAGVIAVQPQQNLLQTSHPEPGPTDRRR